MNASVGGLKTREQMVWAPHPVAPRMGRMGQRPGATHGLPPTPAQPQPLRWGPPDAPAHSLLVQTPWSLLALLGLHCHRRTARCSL